MKSTQKIVYWSSTILVSAMMGMAAFAYLTRAQPVMESLASLGFPDYFSTILGVAKVAGVIALLVPHCPLIKEWAYAGFTFIFVCATFSHLCSDQTNAALMPLLALVLLGVSYFSRPVSRRYIALWLHDSDPDHVSPISKALRSH